MAALAAVVTALARSAWRNVRGLGSLIGNNLFPVIAVLMAQEPVDRPSSTSVFYLVIGLLLAIPLANDLARRIPRDRLELWPLRPWHRVAIAGVNLLLNPALFVALAFALLSRHASVGAFLFLVGAAAPLALSGVRTIAPRRHLPGLLHIVPHFPGRLGGLVQSSLREMLQTLDVWFAAFFSIAGMLYRLLDPNADPASVIVLGGLLTIVLSTIAQPGFGFDSEALRTRARLLPVSGVDLLLARDIAWLVVVLLITLPYRIVPCAAGALAALAVGHRTAEVPHADQYRWHFAAGHVAPTGLYQILAIILATAGVQQFGPAVLAVCVAAWAGSLWWYGRRLA